MMWLILFVVLLSLFAGAALFKHRERIKMDAAAEAYRIRQAAIREEEKLAGEAKQLYQSAKSKLL